MTLLVPYIRIFLYILVLQCFNVAVKLNKNNYFKLVHLVYILFIIVSKFVFV